jgi:hypothetical protein
MIRSPLPLRLRLAMFGFLALLGCHCGPARPPDESSVRHMTDPYDKLPAHGAVPDSERAIAAIDSAAQQMGYGAPSSRWLRDHATETWARGIILLLADGRDEAIELAWTDLDANTVRGIGVTPDVKLLARKGEGRVYDYRHLHADADFLRREYLAEMAWLLYLFAANTPGDGGISAY